MRRLYAVLLRSFGIYVLINDEDVQKEESYNGAAAKIMDYNYRCPNDLQILILLKFRYCPTEEFVDFSKYLENKLEIDNTLSDTVTTFSHDKMIPLF